MLPDSPENVYSKVWPEAAFWVNKQANPSSPSALAAQWHLGSESQGNSHTGESSTLLHHHKHSSL